MKVGFVCQGWAPDPGGIESHTQDLARHLRGAGHAVSALCLDYAAGLEPYSVRDHVCDGVRVRRMAYRYHDHRRLIDLVRNGRADAVVERWLADERFEVVHVHHLTGFGAGALFTLRERGVPCLMTLHDYWMLCPRGQMLSVEGTVCNELDHSRCESCTAHTWPHLFAAAGAARERTMLALESLRVPDRLLVPSASSLEVFVRSGVPRDRLELLPYGIEVDALAADVEQLRRRHPRARAVTSDLRVGVLGSVQPSKGALELARAMQDPRVAGVTLEVHGPLVPYHGDASYIEALRALASSDSRIRLHGAYAREDLAAILASLDAVAVPSRWNEVFGLVAREAAACGIFLLVSDRGGLPEVAENVDRAEIVPADDREAWVRALAALRASVHASTPTSASETLARACTAASRIASIYAELGARAAANNARVRS